MGANNQLVGGCERMLLFGMLMPKLGHTDSLQLLAMAVDHPRYQVLARLWLGMLQSSSGGLRKVA
jgi:hypothetical protein